MPIILDKINKSFNDKAIFKDFSFIFKESNIYTITGKVGVGKTTLLNIISGISEITSGTISGLKDKKISYLFQDNRLLKSKNVIQNIQFVMKDTMSKDEANKVSEEYLKMFDLYDYKDYNINELSGGMQKKLSIARALAVPNYDILILDEPFNNIDVKQRTSIMNNIIQSIPKHAIVIIVTHNIDDLKNYIHKFYILDHIPNSRLEIKTTV